MKKICLTLGATIMLSLGALAQTTPTQEQEKMSEPGQNTEVNGSRERATGKGTDDNEPSQSVHQQSKPDRAAHKTGVQKQRTKKQENRRQNDEDESGRTKKKGKDQNRK